MRPTALTKGAVVLIIDVLRDGDRVPFSVEDGANPIVDFNPGVIGTSMTNLVATAPELDFQQARVARSDDNSLKTSFAHDGRAFHAG